MNENDYDEDGNNIVPCPICLDKHCPGNDDGKCPKEDEFVADMEEKVETIHDKYNRMSDAEKEIFTLGRVSVLEDFDGICAADAFMGFTDDEFAAVKKFFAFNKAISVANDNI